MAPPVAVVASTDGFRMRHGIGFSLGEEFGSGPSDGLSGSLYGMDWRIGAQINNALALYVDTHLSFGTAHIGGAGGVTGNFAVAAMGEYTLLNKFAIGAGGGYGVLNNPSGPLAQARIAWYPLSSASTTSARRKGLMVGFDARFYFADAMQVGTVRQFALSIGYEKY